MPNDIVRQISKHFLQPQLSTNIPIAPDMPQIPRKIIKPESVPFSIPIAPDDENKKQFGTPLILQPFKGGAITVREPALLPFGAFSMVQNIRAKHPGFVKRPGCRALHTTADSTNRAMSLYQFRKGEVDKNYFYAQMSDGDVLKATAVPPIITTGVFGSEAHDGTSSGMIPASWGNIGDKLLYSNGVNQHQIYGGDGSYVEKLIVCKMTAAIPDIPTFGEDYSYKVRDGRTTTVAVLDDLDTYTNHDCMFIKTPVPVKSFTFTIPKPNGNASDMSVYYRKNDNTWAAVSDLSDGTADTGKTLATTGGTVTFTMPTDIQPKYQYGSCGWWYQFRFSAVLSAEVEISAVTWNTDWQDLVNVWDGVPLNAIEVYVEGTSQYETYSSGAVDLDGLAAGKKIYVISSDPIEGIYIDPGATPNATGTNVTSLKYWNGAAFATVGTDTDGTSGMSRAGWITFPRKTAHPRQFETSMYQAYVYELIWDSAISADTVVSIQVMPYFDIDEAGEGYSNCVWKDMGIYSFDQYGEYIYIAQPGNPMVLNGSQYGILTAGDGRTNKIRALRKLHNEMIAWQEEKGPDGGCVTLFEGYSPTTFGKLILSSKLGTMNNNCVVVVDGVLTSTKTNEKIATMAFWLSRQGVPTTDGHSIHIISDDIQNYFDPQETECIRRGYEEKMFLSYDSSWGALRLGLVSAYPLMTSTATSTTANKLVDTAGAFTTRKTPGKQVVGTIQIGDTISNTTDSTTALVTAIDSATILSLDTDIMASGEAYDVLSSVPNVFPVFDLVDKGWSFDLPAQSFSCMAEVEAGSGQIPVLQVAGGVSDGLVYQTNYGTNDVSTAIDAFTMLELGGKGEFLSLETLVLRCKTQASGDITVTIYGNNIQQTTFDLSMIAEVATQTIRRHRTLLGVVDQHISIKMSQPTASVELYLEDIGVDIKAWVNR